MDFKPRDFFIGLIELLAFIVPGMIIFVALPFASGGNFPDIFQFLARVKMENYGWVAFLTLSYIYGNIFHGISSCLLNCVYNKLVLKKREKREQVNKTPLHLFLTEVVEKVKLLKPTDPDYMKTAEIYVRIKNKELAAELENYSANGKLFRSLTLLCAGLCFLLPFYGLWIPSIFIIGISFLCAYRFVSYRWEQRLLTFKYFAVLSYYEPPIQLHDLVSSDTV